MASKPVSPARFIGRVGGLALALGIGAVLGCCGVAAADADADADGADGAPAAQTRASAQTRTAVVRSDAPSGRDGTARGTRASHGSAAPAASAAAAGASHGSFGLGVAVEQAATPAPKLSAPAAGTDRASVTVPTVQAAAPAAVAPSAATAVNGPAAVATPVLPMAAVAMSPAPAATAVAPAATALESLISPLSGTDGGLPLQSPAPWAALAVTRRFGRGDARSLATARTAVPAAAATTGTTTTITWGWGTNPVLSFNPAADKLDFGWMQASAFDVTEVTGVAGTTGPSTRISIVGNNHTYTLQGIPLSQLTMTNIVAKDSSTVTKWQNLLAASQTVTAPTVSIGNITVAEGNSGTTTAAFTVTLSKAATRTVTVGYSTANGTATAGQDYTATSGTLTFAAGVTSAKVNVAVTGDTTVEPDETFTVTLSAPSGATLGNTVATGTISNDDTAVVVTPPTVSIANATVSEGNSGSSTLAFTVALSKASDKTVTVGYSTANGTATAGQDYTATSGTLTFAPGSTAQQISVAVAGDTVVEPNETLTVTLAGPTNATLSTATATGTIVNDDTATTPPATADRWGTSFYAPYVDMGGWPVPDLLAISKTNGGGSLFTAAFMQATPDGKLAWAGLNALEPGATNDQATAINSSIKALQAAGGDVMISLGGQAGTSLAQWGSTRGMTPAQLATAYAGVVNTYGITHLDFDIEGAAVADQASITLHSQALKILQQSKPDLKIWYTLPVLPSGLTGDGLKVVDSALKAGVNLAGVNVMAMDYGESAAPTSGPNAKTMGAYAVDSAESTYAQLTKLYGGYGKSFGYGQLGVTPMLGVNDVTSEVFTLADAQTVEDYARAKGLGMVALWSVTRDTPGPLGVSTYTHSGMSAPAGSFAKIFNDYGTVNALTYPATGGGTTGGGTTGGGTSGGGTPVTGGTTTTIGWHWGTNTALAFNPAKDKLDFVWMGPGYFDISEKSGSTVVSIVDNNQTYTLTGVALSQLQMGNIVALDSGTLSKWQAAISAAVARLQ